MLSNGNHVENGFGSSNSPDNDSQNLMTAAAEKDPVASEAALDFLASIEPSDFSSILFSDALVSVSDGGKELGEFAVSVEPARYYSQDCFLVHANSHGAIDSVPCGTSITAYVSAQLETLEQQHHEYVKLESHPLDRKTFIHKLGNKMVINRVINQGEEVERSEKSYKRERVRGFVSEASNLLLQRLLITKNRGGGGGNKNLGGGGPGFPQNLAFLSFDSDVNLCRATYQSLPESVQEIGNEEVRVRGIERTIHSKSDLPTTWHAFFLPQGHLSSRIQVGSPVSMKIVRMPNSVQTSDTCKFKAKNWEEDMQMFSKFLDRKEELKSDHASYMSRHPELKALLADFLQIVLLRKPADVVGFAAGYFSSFSVRRGGEGESQPRPTIEIIRQETSAEDEQDEIL